jgi:predicted CxxxxCH...CXXCH cytochrome family protein
MRTWGLLPVLWVAGCIGAYETPDYTNEDSGVGYEVDFAGEDLVSGPVLPGHYHPAGYAAYTIHGRDLKLQVQDCRTCHGQELNGGVVGAGGGTIAPPGCDGCHPSGWRSSCTFCHGTTGGNGAPPRDLNGETNPAAISFPGHPAHQSGRITRALDCNQCHRKPTDVLSPYHVFDASPRRGENNLSGGLSPQGVYDPVNKGCTNTYCHGNGRANGTVTLKTASQLTCSGCHADATTPALWNTMSGDHARHLRDNGVDCTTCHNTVTAAQTSTISDKALHVDGQRQVAFAAGLGNIAWNAAGRTCTGTCHNKNHTNDTW